jgi:hypothetical protein
MQHDPALDSVVVPAHEERTRRGRRTELGDHVADRALSEPAPQRARTNLELVGDRERARRAGEDRGGAGQTHGRSPGVPARRPSAARRAMTFSRGDRASRVALPAVDERRRGLFAA